MGAVNAENGVSRVFVIGECEAQKTKSAINPKHLDWAGT
jgi:hypothetical protein